MKIIIAILATLAILIAGSALARDRGPSHRRGRAYASAINTPGVRAAVGGFDGWPTDYLIERLAASSGRAIAPP